MKKKLSILIYSLASGGAERVVSILLDELKDRYDISLVLMNDTIFYNIPKNINITYLSKSNVNESGIKKLLKIPFLAYKYFKFCKKNKIDVSLSFMNRPNYINVISKILSSSSKILISERIAPSQEYLSNSLKDKISKYLIKYLYPKADLIIPNAQGIKSDLEIEFGIDKNIIEVINNPINLDKINNLKKQNITQLKDDDFNFVTIGRFDYQKNHKLLISAMKNIDAKLYIIGDGSLRKDLEKHISELDLNNKVILLGRQENPYKYISKADCFIFSSNYEGFPNVLLEALACDLPIISTDCKSGPREILSDDKNSNIQLKDNIQICEYGILTPIKNEKLMIKAINLIMEDKKLKESYKNKALKKANMFTKEKIIKQWINIIEN